MPCRAPNGEYLDSKRLLSCKCGKLLRGLYVRVGKEIMVVSDIEYMIRKQSTNWRILGLKATSATPYVKLPFRWSFELLAHFTPPTRSGAKPKQDWMGDPHAHLLPCHPSEQCGFWGERVEKKSRGQNWASLEVGQGCEQGWRAIGCKSRTVDQKKVTVLM